MIHDELTMSFSFNSPFLVQDYVNSFFKEEKKVSKEKKKEEKKTAARSLTPMGARSRPFFLSLSTFFLSVCQGKKIIHVY